MVLSFFAGSLALAAPMASAAISDEWPAFSAERAGSPQYRACMAKKQANIDEAYCLSQELARQQTELRIAFEDKVRDVSPVYRAAMIKAQEAWKIYVAKNCAVRVLSGGSGAGIFKVSCLVRETITRRTELTDNWDY